MTSSTSCEREFSDQPSDSATRERLLGCLFGGAVADSRNGHIGYSTQLTLWTAEGLLRAVCRSVHKGICYPPGVVYHALLRWLRTQGELSERFRDSDSSQGPWDGWLYRRKRLFRATHAGGTIMGSLRRGVEGTVERPVNDSLGAGVLAHVAPCAFMTGEDPLELARTVAALTHGHPAAQWAAGAAANIVKQLADGLDTEQAIAATIERLQRERGSDRVVRRLSEALDHISDGAASVHPFSNANFANAPDALALAVFAARNLRDFSEVVAWIRDVNGVSRVAVSLAGQLMGTRVGFDGLPAAAIKTLRTRDIIETVGLDLITLFDPSDEWLARYPGW